MAGRQLDQWRGRLSPFRSRFSTRLPPQLEQQFIDYAMPEVSLLARRAIVVCLLVIAASSIVFSKFFHQFDLNDYLIFAVSLVVLAVYYRITFITSVRYRHLISYSLPILTGTMAVVFFETVIILLEPGAQPFVLGTIVIVGIGVMVFERLFFMSGLSSALVLFLIYAIYHQLWGFEFPLIRQVAFQFAVALIVGGGASLLHHRSDRLRFLADLDAAEGSRRNQELMDRILPRSWSQQITDGGTESVAEHYPMVTVIFADLAGFTAAVKNWPPQEVLRLLNQMFNRFDDEAELCGVEKVKTIGDGYMAVAGCPEYREDHAERAVQFAQRLQHALADVAKRFEVDLGLRVGVHSGSVVAGIVGRKRFGFDLWGDTVNRASRIESQATVGSVLMSQATVDLLDERYRISQPTEHQLKGVGAVSLYSLLEAPRTL